MKRGDVYIKKPITNLDGNQRLVIETTKGDVKYIDISPGLKPPFKTGMCTQRRMKQWGEKAGETNEQIIQGTEANSDRRVFYEAMTRNV